MWDFDSVKNKLTILSTMYALKLGSYLAELDFVVSITKEVTKNGLGLACKIGGR